MEAIQFEKRFRANEATRVAQENELREKKAENKKLQDFYDKHDAILQEERNGSAA
jgi:hypothetical protein